MVWILNGCSIYNLISNASRTGHCRFSLIHWPYWDDSYTLKCKNWLIICIPCKSLDNISCWLWMTIRSETIGHHWGDNSVTQKVVQEVFPSWTEKKKKKLGLLLKQKEYSGDLKSGQVWILNGQKKVGLQMVWILNVIWNLESGQMGTFCQKPFEIQIKCPNFEWFSF